MTHHSLLVSLLSYHSSGSLGPKPKLFKVFFIAMYAKFHGVQNGILYLILGDKIRTRRSIHTA